MLNLFLPEICIHCGLHCSSDRDKPLSKYLCRVCLRQFELFEPPLAEQLIPKSSIFREIPYELNIGAAFSFENGGIMQSLIHHIKYNEMPKLGKILGRISAEKNYEKEYDYLVPVPLHRTRYSERGYNQSEMLAAGMGSIPVAKRNWLKRIRQTPTQTGLTLEQREENVRGAFQLTQRGKEALYGKRILIMDDVMTTGATLASVASAVVEAEPNQIDLFALAAVID